MMNAQIKFSPKKREAHVYVNDTFQLDKALLVGTKQKIVVGGHLVICSLEPLKNVTGFASQAPRAAKGGISLDAKRRKYLNVVIDKEALEKLSKSSRKVTFAIDALLKYGLRIKGKDEHCLISAQEAKDSTQITVLFFKRQELLRYNEYLLSHTSQSTYEADLHKLIERLNQEAPQCTFHWCGPVTKPRAYTFKSPEYDIWAAATSHSLNSTGKPPFLSRHGLAGGLVALSLIGYCVSVYLPYSQYQQARTELHAESAGLEGETAFSAERLGILRARQGLFEKQIAKTKRFEKFVDLLATFAQEPNIVVRSATLLNDDSKVGATRPGRPTEYDITIEVPSRGESVPVLDQGKALLTSLSARTGANLRLATGVDSYQSEGGKGAGKRIYKVQGDFKK